MAINLNEKFIDDSNLWEFYRDDIDINRVYITNYLGSELEVVVPSQIFYQSVPQSVYETYYLFYKDTNVTKVTFENGIEVIGSCTCYQCDELRSVILPHSIRVFETYSFWNCIALNGITIPTQVVEIGDGSLCNCTSLMVTKLPNNLNNKTLSSSFLFRNCPNLTIHVDYFNTKGIEYLQRNGLKYKIDEKDSPSVTPCQVQGFMAGVADVQIFNKEKLVTTAKTLIDSSLSLGITAEDIRAGQGAKLYGKYFHTSSVDFNLTDAMFRMEYFAENVGSDVELGGEAFCEEILIPDEDGAFTLKNIPVPMIIGRDDIYVYWKQVGTNFYNVFKLDTPTRKIKIEGVQQNIQYCVKYLYSNDNAQSIQIKANFTPDTLTMYLTCNLYSGDATGGNLSTKIGTVTIKIPRLLLQGSQDLSMNMTGAANMALKGSALSTREKNCAGDGVYAEIVEVLTANKNDIVALRVESGDDVIYLDKDTKYPLTVYAEYYGANNQKFFSKIDNSKLTFSSVSDTYLTVDSRGVITAKESTQGVVIPIIVTIGNYKKGLSDMIGVVVR